MNYKSQYTQNADANIRLYEKNETKSTIKKLFHLTLYPFLSDKKKRTPGKAISGIAFLLRRTQFSDIVFFLPYLIVLCNPTPYVGRWHEIKTTICTIPHVLYHGLLL